MPPRRAGSWRNTCSSRLDYEGFEWSYLQPLSDNVVRQGPGHGGEWMRTERIRRWLPAAATAAALIGAAPAAAADFTSGFETADPAPISNTTVEASGVSGTKPGLPGS